LSFDVVSAVHTLQYYSLNDNVVFADCRRNIIYGLTGVTDFLLSMLHTIVIVWK